MYAIVDFKGFQYRAEKDAVIRVPLLSATEPGHQVELDQVLLVRDEDNIIFGQPYVAGAKVVAEVVNSGKDKKVVIFHKNRRKGYRVKKGFRAQFTDLRITDIITG
ncbi:MAG TPA: 50S ribosomal protein L21 [Candidatus Cloacimonadota bacterium]|nr:50S ribosomal protein L21 [Candidatus Cloacimonadota bacterium]